MTFRKSSSDVQMLLTGYYYQLPEHKRKKMDESEEAAFYEKIVARINEEPFGELYCQDNGAPNKPIRQMIGAYILMHYKNWSTRELFDHINFNLLTMRALGIVDYEESPFCRATFFNFLSRLADYYVKTGENLLEQVFDHLTAREMEELGIKGKTQRTDSFQAISNIVSYTRVRLLVEILLRLHRVLPESDKKRFAQLFGSYVEQDASSYVHKLHHSDVPKELEQLGETYYKLHKALKENYGELEVFQLFERALEEQFTCAGEKVKVRPGKDIPSDSLQSPDDPEATYRNKNGKKSRGQVVSVTETADPEDEVNLLTDVVVAPNNKDDADIHKERVGKIKEKTPEIEENHTDGGYGSGDVDEKMEKHEVKQVVTGIRGRESEVEMDIEEEGETYRVSCPNQSAVAKMARKRWKASFDPGTCEECAVSETCPAQQLNSGRAFYFDRKDFLARRRNKSLQNIPEERRKIRPNVEATLREFYGGFTHTGKLPYRGRFRTEVFAFCTAIGINFGRVVRHMEKKHRQEEVRAGNLSPMSATAIRKMLNYTFSHLKKFPDGIKKFCWSFFTQNERLLSAA